MNELVRSLSQFISRDIFYILGGASVLASGLYALGELDRLGTSTPEYIFFAGLSYVIGYAVQDGLSLTPLVSTKGLSGSDPHNPNRFVRWLYRRFERKPWGHIPREFDRPKASRDLRRPGNEGLVIVYERVVTLKQIGTTMGPCFFLAGCFLLGRAAFVSRDPLDWSASLFAFAFGSLLLCLGWLKASQQVRYLYEQSLDAARASVSEPQP
ncbi:MAG: hypothetical protein AAGI52_13355 [Bacteroidota bacterium]